MNTRAHIVNPGGPVPRGVSDFTKLREGGYAFVDKSLFIKEILDGGDDVTLITRPRRFGKTINLNMLRCFLHWPLDHQPDLFDGLAISRAGEEYQRERGKRPVLFLTFKDIKAGKWDDAWIKLRGLLANTAEIAARGAPSDRLTRLQQKTLRGVIEGTAKPAECQSILAILTELLTRKHGEKPWVLIDEYDTPLHAAYQSGYYDDMRNVMQGLLGQGLKDNADASQPQTFLHKAVITGILRVAKEDIFSDLNNLGVYGVSQDRFSPCFGFTPAEINDLLAARGIADRFNDVRAWYDGYRLGRATTIYNPWSVINYLANPNDPAQPYWVNTSSNHLVHHLLTRADAGVKRGLRQLLDEANPVTIQRVQQNVPLQELEADPENLWGLLLASGYLTLHPRVEEGKENTARESALRIPNKEVREVYDTLARKWLRGGESGSGGGMELLEALVAGEVDAFAERFERLVFHSMSYFDPSGDEPERFYHGFVLGMVQALRNRYIVASQRESGLGRYDLALEPKDKSKPGFVLEFKTCLRPSDSLSDTAQQALRQIQDKTYHAEMLNRGVEQVIALGLAFRGKEA
ncbi:MAG: AAA family ATPase, partial [Myxococcota bacterium]